MSVNPKDLGELTVSTLRGEQGHQRKEIGKLVDWLRTEPGFDVIALPYTLLIGLAEPLKRALAAPVICTLQGEDLFLSGLHEPHRSQCLSLIREHARHVDRFIAVSAYYAAFMPDFLGIPRDGVDIVPLGIDFEGHTPVEKPAGGPLRIGYFARVCPEKGLQSLCEAVAGMSEPHELRVAGYLPPEHARWLAGLESRYGFKYEGAPDRDGKIRFLQSIDVMSVPSEYAEPKGIFLLEAMANGTPVVQPRRGAYPEIVAKTRGGVLVEPGCRVSLGMALDALARERDRLQDLGRLAAEGVRKHYSVELMAQRTLEVYKAHVGSTIAR
jgi:glycosyltransferase involved in cell wall biosynthesis